MIEVASLAGQPVAVMGLGKSGMASARSLLRSGAEVWAWDDNPARRATAASSGVPVVDLTGADLARARTIVWSPGIPHTHPKPHPIAVRARDAGLEIVCDVELLARSQRDAAYIGVTGTNGKSTTTALIGHVLRSAGRRVEVGGNLGTPALELAPLDRHGIYVLELSSYQLELLSSLAFDVAVLTNITPDHLDRHGGMEGYVRAKAHIFDRQTKPCTAVIGVDDAHSEGIFEALTKKSDRIVVPISAKRRLQRGVYAPDGLLIDAADGPETEVADLRRIPTLPGRHNWQNAAAAYAATKPTGASPSAIAVHLESFPGLAHRQELIATIGGVRFVNDSKATNADAAEKALVCYEHIHWIAGGRAKEGGIASLAHHFGRIAHAYLIGEAAGDFARTLEGRVPHTHCGTLAKAVVAANAAATRERAVRPVVLLSPACASWDQFENFEARGEAFRALVGALPGADGPRRNAEVRA
ncbi:MAG TPA: UDP-N-acetylmuramoyl-L-alanine--D-glutamate ligase [Alphaproteobacteria bacterium]|nr:UDP-N-acetylmuramoyl-L-alanine--D-glutamate ligase [Alphaproteobacteria bacterium]